MAAPCFYALGWNYIANIDKETLQNFNCDGTSYKHGYVIDDYGDLDFGIAGDYLFVVRYDRLDVVNRGNFTLERSDAFDFYAPELEGLVQNGVTTINDFYAYGNHYDTGSGEWYGNVIARLQRLAGVWTLQAVMYTNNLPNSESVGTRVMDVLLDRTNSRFIILYRTTTTEDFYYIGVYTEAGAHVFHQKLSKSHPSDSVSSIGLLSNGKLLTGCIDRNDELFSYETRIRSYSIAPTQIVLETTSLSIGSQEPRTFAEIAGDKFLVAFSTKISEHNFSLLQTNLISNVEIDFWKVRSALDDWEQPTRIIEQYALIHDEFTDLDSTLLINHTPDVGGAWLFYGDQNAYTNAFIESNRARGAVGNASMVSSQLLFSSFDAYVKFALTYFGVAGDPNSVTVRFNSDDYIRIGNGSTITVNGFAFPWQYQPNTTYIVEMRRDLFNNCIEVYIDDVLINRSYYTVGVGSEVRLEFSHWNSNALALDWFEAGYNWSPPPVYPDTEGEVIVEGSQQTSNIVSHQAIVQPRVSYLKRKRTLKRTGGR